MATATLPIDERLDAISAQLASIEAELAEARRRREAREDLSTTLQPVAEGLYGSVSNYLAALDADGSIEDLMSLGRRLVSSAGSMERAVSALESVSALASEAGPIGEQAMVALTTRLAELETRGYFAFARRVGRVVDRVVTSFTKEDVEQLGDNIVLILETVKEMTQPEVMGMLRRTASAVQFQQQVIEDGVEQTPSMLQLMRRMREPEVRRGLSRALEMLRMIAAEAPAHDQDEDQDEGGM